jgi:hypothetical protein
LPRRRRKSVTPPAARPRSPGPFAAYEARRSRFGAGDGYQVAAAEVGCRGNRRCSPSPRPRATYPGLTRA